MIYCLSSFLRWCGLFVIHSAQLEELRVGLSAQVEILLISYAYIDKDCGLCPLSRHPQPIMKIIVIS